MVCIKMIAGDRKALEPVVNAAEIRGMEPFLPEPWTVAITVQIRRPLEQPKDVDSFARVFGRSPNDCFLREGAYLHFDGNGHIVDVGADIRSGGRE